MIALMAGDRVRRIQYNNGNTGAVVGQIATVVAVHPSRRYGTVKKPMVYVNYYNHRKQELVCSEGWFEDCTELLARPVAKQKETKLSIVQVLGARVVVVPDGVNEVYTRDV